MKALFAGVFAIACVSTSAQPADQSGADADRRFVELRMASVHVIPFDESDGVDHIDLLVDWFQWGRLAISVMWDDDAARDYRYPQGLLTIGLMRGEDYVDETLANGSKTTIPTKLYEAKITRKQFDRLLRAFDPEKFALLPTTNAVAENEFELEEGMILLCDGGNNALSMQIGDARHFAYRSTCHKNADDIAPFAAPLIKLGRKTFPELSERLHEAEHVVKIVD